MSGSDRKYRVAVCGATGAVGREMIRILQERDFPLRDLRLLASERSCGERIEFCDEEIAVETLEESSLKGLDLALFSAGGAVSERFAPCAADAGCVVVDNTSAFRMQDDVPLVVPEVNPEDLAGYSERGIVANPNCATIQLVVALKPLHDAAGLRRVVVATYQSVSGAGRSGIRELEKQSIDLFNLRALVSERFPRQIAFNCLPHIDVFLPEGDTREERKMVDETRKILHLPDLAVCATAVRVPVFYGHAEAVFAELERPLGAEDARELLERAPGVQVMDDAAQELYPTPIDAAAGDEVLVGRIRADGSVPAGLALWVVADNVRKGAALNSVQIAESLICEYL
ncbi:MAG: aspartate-semialdehyde dehydrogenase [Deltaproteobacteria bacterium]|nr:aspartate-semialdehyde dehydrogenase [Deltaproteobacteria bacterium]